jgi:CO/xanthine dehydrogenase Mo-binding subunit
MKNILAAILLLFLPFIVSAQRNNRGGNEIEAYKVSYLKEKLELSPEESKIFWPIYTAWTTEQAALRAERREKMISFRKITEIEDLSDTEVQSLINNELNFKQRDLNIERKYYNKLKSSLPIKTVGKYYRAQETFKRELLSRYRDGKKPQD